VIKAVWIEEEHYRKANVDGRCASYQPALIASTTVSDEVKLAAKVGLARMPLRSPEWPCDVRDNVVRAGQLELEGRSVDSGAAAVAEATSAWRLNNNGRAPVD
jgi:hypothetical protein